MPIPDPAPDVPADGTGRAGRPMPAESAVPADPAGPGDPDPAEGPDGGVPAGVAGRLRAFLVEQGMTSPGSFADWATSPIGGDWWLLTPPGSGDVLFAVTPDAVRPILPARESIEAALADLRRPATGSRRDGVGGGAG